MQESYRCNKATVIKDFDDAAIVTANMRAAICIKMLDQADVIDKLYEPNKLKGGKDWYDWRDAVTNYLSILMGSNGVPLSYVVRVLPAPASRNNFSTYEEEVIALVPLNGAFFNADSKRVHQVIKTYTQCESAGEWIRSIQCHQDGRRNFTALKAHFQGEGNSSRRINEADRVRETLYYKNKSSFEFQSYLDELQKMFTIYKDEKEAFYEEAKVRLLLDKLKCPHLQYAKTQSGLTSSKTVRFSLVPLTT